MKAYQFTALNPLYQPQPIYRGVYDIEPLLDVIRDQNLIIAGGFARWMLSPNAQPAPASDIDVYGFGDIHAFEKAITMHGWQDGPHVAEYFAYGTVATEQDHRWLTVPNVQAIIFDDLQADTVEGRAVEVMNRFDLDVCRAAVFWDARTYTWQGLAYTSFANAETRHVLDVEGSCNPLATLRRLRKYQAKGYRIANGAPSLCLMQWRLLDPDTQAVLREAENRGGLNVSEEWLEDSYQSYLETLKTSWMTRREVLAQYETHYGTARWEAVEDMTIESDQFAF